MLNQFRVHYPQGSLSSELLMIDHGLYIVRSHVKVGDITLATGLAAAATVEMAEDQARLRALALLNFDTFETKAPTVITPEPMKPQVAIASEPVAVTPKPIEEPNPLPTPKAVKPKKTSVPTPPPPAKIDTVTENLSPVIIPSEPPLIAEVPELSLSEPVDLEVEAIENPIEDNLENLLPSPEVTEKNGKSSQKEIGQTNGNQESALPLESLSLPLLDNALTAEPSELELTQPPSSPTSPVLDLGEPIDFSEIIARSNVELKRLNWTNDQGKNYLLQTYGKRSRQLLSDEELIEFLHYLESQPTQPSA